jgi:hypothetical protein
MKIAYRLKDNAKHIAQVQKATLTTDNFTTSASNRPTVYLGLLNGGIVLQVESCRYTRSGARSLNGLWVAWETGLR